jgi:hypothetical protein
MRTLRVSCAALAAALLTACGGSADPAKPAHAATHRAGGTTKLAATTQASADSAPKPDSDAKTQAAAVALRYLHAVARKDWAAACATRTAHERRYFGGATGSCARTFRIMFGSKPVALFAYVRVRFVRIRHGIAGVHLTRPMTKLAAVRDHGHWRLKDMKNKKVP